MKNKPTGTVSSLRTQESRRHEKIANSLKRIQNYGKLLKELEIEDRRNSFKMIRGDKK